MRTVTACLLAAVLFLFVFVPAQGQKDLSGAAEIALQLEKLNVLGSVLMIAAHPDDENTALLAYFARGRKLRTAYLSATRGEGGQNLIGSEQGDYLGVIRTQELLAARRIDGAEQFFTRAIDFGFTKTAEETLEKWGRERILSDMVWTIRHYRPDVVILRFSGTPRDGHGQHQVSAIIGREAYLAAADKNRFPEQNIEPWKATRLLQNTQNNPNNPQAATKKGGAPTKKGGKKAAPTPPSSQAVPAPDVKVIQIDTAEFNPVLGKSYNEIAGLSRSQHKSQAMGSGERRGGPSETGFTVLAGEAATKDPLEGIDTSWNRLQGGAEVGQILAEAARSFLPQDPSKTIPLLLKARPLIVKLAEGPSGFWAARKLRELDEAIASCAGLWVDVTADHPTFTPGATMQLTLTAINRSKYPVSWMGPSTALAYNQPATRKVSLPVPADQAYSQPFWLAQPKSGSTYTIDRQEMRDLPDSPPYYMGKFQFQAGSETIELERPLHYRFVDPERGELTRPVVVVPAVAVSLSDSAFVFPSGKPQKVQAQVKANVAKASGELRLAVANGWKVTPASLAFNLADAGEQKELTFEVTPPAQSSSASVRAVATVGGRQITSDMRTINYTHIPLEILFPVAEARAERVNVTNLAKKVGYVMGAGDDVPRSLRQLGCDVTLLGPEDLAGRNLSEFDAIVTGVRAYNVRPDLRANQNRLMNYVQAGGTVIVQYNVPDRGQRETGNLAHIGPYPLRVGGERVTMEEAPVKFPNADQILITAPNKITAKDFDGWVQERGLYFAAEWDPQYKPVFEMNDPGQEPQKGSTLYAKYGKGTYIFSALDWFRELPAGVPGAYRIFANFLSSGKVAK